MIDLHTHTTASDGVIEPEALVKKAKDLGLSTIAISDHDQVSGITEALLAAEKYGLEVIPAVELSTCWTERNRKEFHILGYFIDYQNPGLLERLRYFQEIREKRAKKILTLLEGLGYASDLEYLQKIAKGSMGMPHAARTCLDDPRNKEKILTEFGKMPPVNVFIEKYMIQGKPAHVFKADSEPKEAIDFIHKVGGVAVWAHPCFDVPIGDREMIKIFKNWGIEGVEALAPFRTLEATKESVSYFSQLARENNLLITGGSDYHGIDGIGAGLGLLEWGMKIEDEILEKLKIILGDKIRSGGWESGA